MQFEHALVNHISGKGFHIAAQVYPSKGGATYVTREETIAGERVTRLFAVYEMLEGEDKYTWISNRLHRHGVRERRARAGPVPRARPRLRPRRPCPRAAADHGLRRASSRASSRPTRPQSRGTAFDEYYLAKLPSILEAVRSGVAIGRRPRGDAAGPGALRLSPRQPQVGRRAGRRAVRLRLVQARLPALRRRAGHRLLLQLVGGPGRRRACVSTRRPSSCAPTRTRRRASRSPAR